jgi:GMP synthase (glutamine-hydrolysing)
VLIYVTGEPPAPIAAEHGRFPAWFRALADQEHVVTEVFDGTGPGLPPDPRSFAGVVVTGSPASVTAPEPWMEMAVEFIRSAATTGTPVLGVCFGHQLIGAAYGGSVVRNPAGWEVSTWDVELTAAGRRDPLFDGLPERFSVNFSHADVVDHDTLSPANGVRILASNPRARAQAIGAGDSIRGVQFHPEFSAVISQAYVRTRYSELAEDAARRGADDDHPERRLAAARDSAAGRQVFANFIRHFVRKS